jgi:hypothetical protein
MRQINSPLGHHLDEVSKTRLEPQIPPHKENDDLPVEMAPSEELVDTQHMGSDPLASASQSNMPRFRYLHQSRKILSFVRSGALVR